MSKTRIVRFHRLGGPDVLQLDEVPMPQPGEGEVRLRVEAFGLNRAEVLFRQGKYLQQPKLPCTLGYEAAGVVEAVGAGVDVALKGKRFSTVPCFSASDYGVYGEVAIVPAYALAAYPSKLSAVEGTSIWMQYLTAYGALVMHGGIGQGDFVIVTAASSSVGIAALEIIRAQGATSIATTRSPKKKGELAAAGADHVIATDSEDLAARVKAITGGKGARVTLDAIAGPGVQALVEAAAPAGRIFEYGALSMAPTPFPLFAAMSKGVSMQGYTLFDVVAVPERRARAEKYVRDHLESGAFKPRVDKTFPLEQVAQAHAYMEAGAQIGKIVVTVA